MSDRRRLTGEESLSMQLWEAIRQDGVRLFSGTATLKSPILLRITLHPHYVRKPNTLADPQSYTFMELYFSLSLASHEKQWAFLYILEMETLVPS